MNLKYIIISFLIFTSYSMHAQLQLNYATIFPVTASTATITPTGQIRHAAVDPAGNTYLAGLFNNTIDADPGPNVLSLSTTGPLDDNIFFLKLDPNGTLLWAHKIGGVNTSESINSITADASGLYIAGRLFGTSIDMNPGSGTAFNSSLGDGFFAKYDANGNYVFVKSINEVDANSSCDKIAIDSMKNIYIAGTGYAYSTGPGTIDVNPSSTAATTFTVTAGHTNLFYSKYDSLGNFIWGKQIKGKYSYSQDLQLDKEGNIFITGVYGSTGNDFDPGPSLVLYETSNTTQTGNFFAKYNNSGDYIFAKNIRNTGVVNATYSNSAINSIRIGANKDIYLGGNFKGRPDFNPSSTVNFFITATGGAGGAHDGFLAKYDSLGNYQWVRTFGNSKQDYINAMDIDATDKLYYTGQFQDTVDFNPSATDSNIISAPARVGFIGAIDSSGAFLFAQKFSDSLSLGRGLTINNNNLYLTGTLTDIADLNFDSTISNNITLTAKTNLFLSKNIISNLPLRINLLTFNGSKINEGNNLMWTTSSEINNDYFIIEHSTDAKLFEHIGTEYSKAIGSNFTGNLEYNYLHTQLIKGNNYYRLKQVDLDGSFTYSNVIYINNAAANEISIYPNPAKEQLFVNIDKKNAAYQIENSVGKIIDKGILSSSKTISLQNYLQGLYIIRIENKAIKFVKE